MDLLHRLRRLLGRLRCVPAHGVPREAGGWAQLAGPADEAPSEPDGLAEFLQADRGPLPVAPGFRSALRERLWLLVQEQARTRRAGGEGDSRVDDPTEPVRASHVAGRQGGD